MDSRVSSSSDADTLIAAASGVHQLGSDVTAAAPSALYDANYYHHGCGPIPYDRSEPWWPEFFGQAAAHLIKAIQPRRVLDAGCAVGFLVEAFWDRGVEAWGIDISPYAIENVRRDMQPYCRLGSIATDIEGHYDLITCIEVLEHMPEAEALEAIRLMCSATDTIFFSSTPFDHDEPTHCNVRPLLYWLTAFQQHGFAPDLRFDCSFVASHAMLFRRTGSLWPLEVLQTFAALLHARQEISVKGTQHREAFQAQQVAERRVAELERSNEDQLRQIEELRQARDQAAAELESLRAELVRDLDARLSTQIQETNTRLAGLEIDTRNKMDRIEGTLSILRQELSALASTLHSIIQSRIWRTLVRVGGLVPLGRRRP